jgi:hypothetical protein
MGHNIELRQDALIQINYGGIIMLKILDIIKTIKRKIKLAVAVLQLYTLSSVLTLSCMNDLTGTKVLICELLLRNAVKDIYFTSMMKLKKFLKN